MTARDDLAVLFERRIIGEDPDDRRYERALRQAASELDDLASLATNPETAPVVFRWLVEAGVLVPMPSYMGHGYYKATAEANVPPPCPVVIGQHKGPGPGLFITCGKPHFVLDHKDDG